MTQETNQYSYVGTELELFAGACNWKRYWAGKLRPFVHGDVLDIGAGLGSTFEYLHQGTDSWTCLEPDERLCKQLSQRLSASERPPRTRCGTLEQLGPDERFDTLLYIDVLEHIEQDAEQLRAAVRHLAPGGSLIVLSPALPWLFSPFDKSVGHFRRYTRRSLASVAPPRVTIKSWFFLDGLGVLASLFARVAKRSVPTTAQIATWDALIVPLSRLTDTLTSRWFGRTIVMIWVKDSV